MPWLGRWAAADPLQGEMPVWSSYNYGYCNPVKWTDSTGMMSDPDKKDDNQGGAGKQNDPITVSGPNSWRDKYGHTYSYDGKQVQMEDVDIKGEKKQPAQHSHHFHVSAATLAKIFPHGNEANLSKLAEVLNENMEKFGIDNNNKLAHFLAQAGVESKQFNSLKESLKYRSTATIMRAYSNKFRGSGRNPSDYIEKDEKLGNYVYANSLGNGNEKSGDGYKFLGRGIFQLTGKYNYNEFTKFYQAHFDSSKDFVSHPELIEKDYKIAIISALWFFQTRVLNKLDINKASVEAVTSRINHKLLDLELRKTYYNRSIKNLN